MSISKLIGNMIEYFGGLRYAEHALKVYGYALGIGGEEGLGESDMLVLSAAAVIHDIGIPNAIKIHGSGKGPFQEKEGALLVPEFVEKSNLPSEIAEKVQWLVGHHHSYEFAGESILLQILMEADYLVNLSEKGLNDQAETVRNEFFKTKAGIRYINALFGLE